MVTPDSFAEFRRESVSGKLFQSSVPDVCSVASLFWGIEVLVSAELKVSLMFPEAIEAMPAAIIFSTAWLKAGLLVLANELNAVVCAGSGFS